MTRRGSRGQISSPGGVGGRLAGLPSPGQAWQQLCQFQLSLALSSSCSLAPCHFLSLTDQP